MKPGINTSVKDHSCRSRKNRLPLSHILTSRRRGDRNSSPIDDFCRFYSSREKGPSVEPRTRATIQVNDMSVTSGSLWSEANPKSHLNLFGKTVSSFSNKIETQQMDRNFSLLGVPNLGVSCQLCVKRHLRFINSKNLTSSRYIRGLPFIVNIHFSSYGFFITIS